MASKKLVRKRHPVGKKKATKKGQITLFQAISQEFERGIILEELEFEAFTEIFEVGLKNLPFDNFDDPFFKIGKRVVTSLEEAINMKIKLIFS